MDPLDDEALAVLTQGLVNVQPGVWVGRHERVIIGGHLFMRQFTPENEGGGFVAIGAFVPPEIPIPYDWFVYPGTVVCDDAQLNMAGQGPRISGNVHRVSLAATGDWAQAVKIMAARKLETILGRVTARK